MMESSSNSKNQAFKSSSSVSLDGKTPSSPARSLSKVSSESTLQVPALSSSSFGTTSTASTEGGKEISSLPFFYGTHGISLSFAATLSTLLFVIIVLSISLSILFSSFFQTASVGIDLLAKETILQTTHVVDSSFSLLIHTMFSMANITKIFPPPYSPSLSPEVQAYNMQNIWIPQMLGQNSVNEIDRPVELRFATGGGASIVTINNIRGFVRAQICQLKYPTYLDVPVALLPARKDKFENCTTDVYWVHNLTQHPPDARFRKKVTTTTVNVGVLGPYWNETETKMRHFMATKQNYRGVLLPQLSFSYNPGGAYGPMLVQRAQTISFDSSTGQPIASAAAIIPVTLMNALLTQSLPKTTSSSSSSNSVVSFLYNTNNKYVFSASNVEIPFKFMYLNETGGNVYKGCYARAAHQGCLYNLSDYPPYHLLKLSLSNYNADSGAGETNWSRVVSISEGNPVYQRKFIDDDDDHGTEHIAFKRYLSSDFADFTFQIIIVFPQDFFSGDVVRARSVAIAVVVVITIIGGICCFFVLRISTSSLRKLCDKMNDPFQAKLKRSQQRKLVKSAKQQRAKERIDNKNKNKEHENENENENENEHSPLVEGESNSNGRRIKQVATTAKTEKDLEEEVEEVEEEDNRSWWERIQDWQPDEIDILEEEFGELQEVVLKLRGFMNFDFAHHGAASKKQQKEISASTEKKKESTENEKEKSGVLSTDPNVTATSSTQQQEQQQQQQEHRHKKGVKFDPSIKIPEGPAKVVMTKRKKLEQDPPLRIKGLADYESVVCFAAVCKVPMFSQADRFFNLSNERGRKLLLDVSSAVVSKLSMIGLSNGATLIDFTGDHFLIVIQTRRRKIKTKVPTRLTGDLMKLSEQIDGKLQEFIIQQQHDGNENDAAATTAAVSQTQQALGSEITKQVSFETTEALKNTKPGKKSSNELDAELISTEMHRRITLYAGLAFGTARLFRWPDVKFIGTASASTPTRQIVLSSPSQPVFGSPSSGAVSSSSNLLISSSISRSVSFFGQVIPDAYSAEAKTRIARLRQERHSPKHCIAFSFADSSMFEAVHSRKLKMSINNNIGGDRKSVLVNLNIARVLLVAHVQQEQEQ